jgi:hypothetical protein
LSKNLYFFLTNPAFVHHLDNWSLCRVRCLHCPHSGTSQACFNF